jgi:hypothetical protein
LIRLSRLETAILSPHLRIHFDQQLATLQEQVLVLTLSQRVSTPGRQTALEFRTPQVSHTFSTEKDNTAFNVALSHMLEDSATGLPISLKG